MTTYTLVGNQLTALVEAEEASVDQGKDGIRTATVSYHGRWPGAIAQAAAIGEHPDFSALTRTSFKVKRVSPDMASVTITFVGVVIGVGEGDDGVIRTYSLKGSTGQEPIETHPKFGDFGGQPIAGSLEANAKGAVFDKDGVFKAFAVNTDYGAGAGQFYPDANQDKAGVSSFLSGSVVYSEKAVYSGINTPSSGVLNVAGLGTIQVPPKSPLLPEPGGAYSWILIDMGASEEGEGISVSRSWRLSGSRGWDVKIYAA